MKKFTIIISFISLLFTQGLAQTNTNPINTPEIVQTPPEAAGINRYGDIPVGEYTGTPDISIPLYVAKSGKLQLPISLSYHATGIQVSQEATWVGLGWNLIAGGCITYVPVGGNDQLYVPLTNWTDWLKMFNYTCDTVNSDPIPKTGNEDGYRLWNCPVNTEDGNNNDLSKTKDQILSACLGGQGERDLYSANFLGYSFKFILLPGINGGNPRPVFVGDKNKCKIEHPSNSSFIITGEDGTNYFFYNYEYAESNTFVYLDWLLSAIVSPKGETITLFYSNGSTKLIPSLSERNNTGFTGAGGATRTITSQYYITYNKYLDSIKTDKEIIKFITSDSIRKDIGGNGNRQLDKIKIIDKFTNKEKISYVFKYDYFTGTLTGGDYFNDDNFWTGLDTQLGITENNLRKRLKLLAIAKYDTLNTKGEEHSFSYYETIPLPYKSSFSRDYWGYFNGEDNLSHVINGATRTILPSVLPLYVFRPICTV